MMTKDSATTRAIVSFFTGRPYWSPINYLSFAREGYGKNVYVFKCINMVAMAAAGIKPVLQRKSGGRRGAQRNEIEDHPLLDLLERPNPQQGYSRFVENRIGYLLLSGNAYTERVGPTSGANRGIPRELYTHRPDRMAVIIGDATQPVRGYTYRVDTAAGEPVTFKVDQIQHLKMFNPTSDWYGMGPIESAARSVDQNNESRAWNVGLLQNFARPSGALMTKGRLSADQRKTITDLLDERRGAEQAGRPLVLEGEMDWKDMGLSPVDMAWLEGMKLSSIEIAMAFGVPPEMIGIPQAKTYANYKEARKAFYEETVLPLLDWIFAEDNAWMVPAFGDRLVLDYDRDDIDALQDDRKNVFDMAVGVYAAGITTLNETRTFLGYDEVPDGDTFKAPAPAPVMMHPGSGGAPPPPKKPAADDTTEQPPAKGHLRLAGAKALNLDGPKAKAAHWKRMQATRSRYVRSVQNMVEKQFDRDRKRVVSAIDSAATASQARTAASDAVEAGAAEWRKMIDNAYLFVGRSFATQVLAELKQQAAGRYETKADDAAMTDWQALVQAYLDGYAGTKISQINETTLDQIREALGEGVDAGEGIDDLANRIDGLFLDEIIPNRSEVIARTETIAASNVGSQSAARASGLPLTKEWIATGDDRTREDHADADGQVVGLDEPYEVGDSKLMFPADGSLGADADEVIQCRCTEGYSVDDEEAA